MKKGVPFQERLLLFLGLGLREMLFKVIYGESHCVQGKGFTHVLRIGLLETTGAQVAAEQRVEAGREAFAEAVGYFHHIFLFHAVLGRVDTDEHECAFHKATLGAEAAAAIEADGRIKHLLIDLYAEFFAEAEKGGDSAVEVFVVVEVMDEFVVVRHGFLSRKGS